VTVVEAAIPTLRRFSIDEYHLMAKAGVFAPEERVELLEGEVTAMSPIGEVHAGRTNRANRLFQRRLGDDAVVAVQNPVRLGDGSESQPDVAVLHLRADLYESYIPAVADVLLVLELADTTLRLDLEFKAALYARHGIPEYWVEDIPGDRIVVHRDPTPEGYRTVRSLGRGERLSPLAFPAVQLRVEELLG
jgi:Uma2 family endonuclease